MQLKYDLLKAQTFRQVESARRKSSGPRHVQDAGQFLPPTSISADTFSSFAGQRVDVGKLSVVGCQLPVGKGGAYRRVGGSVGVSASAESNFEGEILVRTPDS
jgi:hypothetical protein